MRKYIVMALAIAILVLGFCFALVGCDLIDRSVFPEGYVEVSELKVKSANVFLSPQGDTSSYQLNVEVYPANANKALTYYVPSKYLKYISVSETGLITAKEVTPDGVVIPLKVTSTTNKNASLIVNVTVTEVEVERISFSPASLTLDYNGTSVLLNPVFEPYYAQDGRNLTYESTNEEVCTVDSYGVVSPGTSAGHAYIHVTANTLGGTKLETWVEVTVLYTPGHEQYRLDVSDQTPAYNQVLGEPKAIKFNLVKLNEHLNPNVDVYWFVDRERVPEMNGQWQYEHIPTVNTKTSYRVRVRICANDEPDIELESEEITIFNPFAGYDLVFANQSTARESYLYGSVHTFAITSGDAAVDHYDWYLRRFGESGLGKKINRTSASTRDLIARMNVEGDFYLTARSVDSAGNKISDKVFDFSVTRFIVGDTLVIQPTLRNDGRPPESYDYYLTECDRYSNPIAQPRYIGASGHGDSFLYPLNGTGNFIISSRAVIEGVVARVDGEPFYYETEVIHVYDGIKTDAAVANDLVPKGSSYAVNNVTDVTEFVVSGVDSDGEKVIVKWQPIEGSIPSYVVEVVKEDGTILFFDSDGNGAATFGNEYVVLPASAVTLQDKFSVRIKEKGGVFSQQYYYGYTAPEGQEQYYFSTIPTERYFYLKVLDGVVTGYADSPRDLGAIMNYLVLYKPATGGAVTTENRRINGYDYKAYTVAVYLAFDLASAAKAYPEVTDFTVPEEYEAFARLTVGVQKAYAPTGYYVHAYSARDDGGYNWTIMVPDGATSVVTSAEIEKEVTISPNYSDEPYGVGNLAFSVNARKRVRVSDSEQLYYALSTGSGATLANDNMINLYNKILAVVNNVIDEDMTDGEKALAFYDWLTTNVIYDTDLATKDVGTEGSRYAGFRLEGVFHYGQAVCDGISKAFVALCAIEGIPCVRVVGELNGVAHAWNKVRLEDGNWYVVDATNGSLNENGVLLTNHAFFGVSDAEYGDLVSNREEFGEYPFATGSFLYYNRTINGCEITISSQSDLDDLINSFVARAKNVAFDLKFNLEFADGEEEILEKILAVDNQTVNAVSEEVVFLSDNRVILRLV